MAFQRHMATNPSSGVDNVTGDLGGVDLALHGFPGIDGLFVTDRFRRVEKSHSIAIIHVFIYLDRHAPTI
jgi:hypothetical protein